jgi:hypothetical protein
MRLALALTLAACPAFAQDAPRAPRADGDGISLAQEGAKLILRGLMTEMQPALDEMARSLDEVGPKLEGLGDELAPKLRQLVAMIDDFKNYDAPVMLPNGDILIRRNAPLVPRPSLPDVPLPGPKGEIDL